MGETKLSRMARKRIEELRPHKTQGRLAAEMGFANANVLSSMKNGKLGIPLARVGDMARVLGIDVGLALRAWAEDHPKFDAEIGGIYGVVSTEEEQAVLRDLRAGRVVVVPIESRCRPT